MNMHQPHLHPSFTNLSLEGQRALVTGASSGIGAGVARALGAAGARVLINYRNGAEVAQQLAEEIGNGAIAVEGDVSSEDDVIGLFDAARREFGGLDILVNNAGLQQDAPFHEMTLAQWNRVIGVNLTGQFLCAREAVRTFIAQPFDPEYQLCAGKIICISSVHDKIPWAGHVNYAASKGGVSLMMQSIAQELAGRKIRCNSVSPGAIKTAINRDAWETPEAEAKLLKFIPYERVGDVADVARVVAWLASDHSDYINGATIYVDGGMTLYPSFRFGG